MIFNIVGMIVVVMCIILGIWWVLDNVKIKDDE